MGNFLFEWDRHSVLESMAINSKSKLDSNPEQEFETLASIIGNNIAFHGPYDLRSNY